MNLISIKPLNLDNLIELSLLMAWRSNPIIYDHFLIQNEPLIWENHFNFLQNNIRHDYLAYLNDRPIGHVALSNLSQSFPELSILIGETTLWGQGLSKIILKLFLDEMYQYGFNRFSARILNSNFSSIRLFNRIGFRYIKTDSNNKNWGIYQFEKKTP